jgi:hypothetical protein
MSLAARFVATQGDYAERSGAGASWDYNAAYTVSWWQYVVSFVASGGTLVAPQLDANNLDAVYFSGADPSLELQARNAGSGTATVGADLVQATWTHLELVRESNASLKLFLNAAATEVAVRTQSVAGRAAAAFATFAYLSNTRMAYLRVHTAALTQAERIAELGSAVAVRSSGLWADWPLQSHVGNVFQDISGNARHLPFGTDSGSGVPAFEDGPTLPSPLILPMRGMSQAVMRAAYW